MLSLTNLHKSFGDHHVLDGVNLDIAAGEITALLGSNGAGKTTLVSVATGISPLDDGHVKVDGRDPIANRSARSAIGVAPQTLGIYPTVTVAQNLHFYGRLAGLGRRSRHAAIDDLANRMDLQELLSTRAGLLSGGQQRRLHTAMAMIGQPRVLFLDEPTVGADVTSRSQILAAVRRVADEGCAVCYTTHYLPEIVELNATVAVLTGGVIRHRGTINELAAATNTPRHDLDTLFEALVADHDSTEVAHVA